MGNRDVQQGYHMHRKINRFVEPRRYPTRPIDGRPEHFDMGVQSDANLDWYAVPVHYIVHDKPVKSVFEYEKPSKDRNRSSKEISIQTPSEVPKLAPPCWDKTTRALSSELKRRDCNENHREIVKRHSSLNAFSNITKRVDARKEQVESWRERRFPANEYELSKEIDQRLEEREYNENPREIIKRIGSLYARKGIASKRDDTLKQNLETIRCPKNECKLSTESLCEYNSQVCNDEQEIGVQRNDSLEDHLKPILTVHTYQSSDEVTSHGNERESDLEVTRKVEFVENECGLIKENSVEDDDGDPAAPVDIEKINYYKHRVEAKVVQEISDETHDEAKEQNHVNHDCSGHSIVGRGVGGLEDRIKCQTHEHGSDDETTRRSNYHIHNRDAEYTEIEDEVQKQNFMKIHSDIEECPNDSEEGQTKRRRDEHEYRHRDVQGIETQRTDIPEDRLKPRKQDNEHRSHDETTRRSDYHVHNKDAEYVERRRDEHEYRHRDVQEIETQRTDIPKDRLKPRKQDNEHRSHDETTRRSDYHIHNKDVEYLEIENEFRKNYFIKNHSDIEECPNDREEGQTKRRRDEHEYRHRDVQGIETQRTDIPEDHCKPRKQNNEHRTHGGITMRNDCRIQDQHVEYPDIDHEFSKQISKENHNEIEKQYDDRDDHQKGRSRNAHDDQYNSPHEMKMRQMDDSDDCLKPRKLYQEHRSHNETSKQSDYIFHNRSVDYPESNHQPPKEVFNKNCNEIEQRSDDTQISRHIINRRGNHEDQYRTAREIKRQRLDVSDDSLKPKLTISVFNGNRESINRDDDHEHGREGRLAKEISDRSYNRERGWRRETEEKADHKQRFDGKGIDVNQVLKDQLKVTRKSPDHKSHREASIRDEDRREDTKFMREVKLAENLHEHDKIYSDVHHSEIRQRYDDRDAHREKSVRTERQNRYSSAHDNSLRRVNRSEDYRNSTRENREYKNHDDDREHNFEEKRFHKQLENHYELAKSISNKNHRELGYRLGNRDDRQERAVQFDQDGRYDIPVYDVYRCHILDDHSTVSRGDDRLHDMRKIQLLKCPKTGYEVKEVSSKENHRDVRDDLNSNAERDDHEYHFESTQELYMRRKGDIEDQSKSRGKYLEHKSQVENTKRNDNRECIRYVKYPQHTGEFTKQISNENHHEQDDQEGSVEEIYLRRRCAPDDHRFKSTASRQEYVVNNYNEDRREDDTNKHDFADRRDVRFPEKRSQSSLINFDKSQRCEILSQNCDRRQHLEVMREVKYPENKSEFAYHKPSSRPEILQQFNDRDDRGSYVDTRGVGGLEVRLNSIREGHEYKSYGGATQLIDDRASTTYIAPERVRAVARRVSDEDHCGFKQWLDDRDVRPTRTWRNDRDHRYDTLQETDVSDERLKITKYDNPREYEHAEMQKVKSLEYGCKLPKIVSHEYQRLSRHRCEDRVERRARERPDDADSRYGSVQSVCLRGVVSLQDHRPIPTERIHDRMDYIAIRQDDNRKSDFGSIRETRFPGSRYEVTDQSRISHYKDSQQLSDRIGRQERATQVDNYYITPDSDMHRVDSLEPRPSPMRKYSEHKSRDEFTKRDSECIRYGKCSENKQRFTNNKSQHEDDQNVYTQRGSDLYDRLKSIIKNKYTGDGRRNESCVMRQVKFVDHKDMCDVPQGVSIPEERQDKSTQVYVRRKSTVKIQSDSKRRSHNTNHHESTCSINDREDGGMQEVKLPNNGGHFEEQSFDKKQRTVKWLDDIDDHKSVRRQVNHKDPNAKGLNHKNHCAIACKSDVGVRGCENRREVDCSTNACDLKRRATEPRFDVQQICEEKVIVVDTEDHFCSLEGVNKRRDVVLQNWLKSIRKSAF